MGRSGHSWILGTLADRRSTSSGLRRGVSEVFTDAFSKSPPTRQDATVGTRSAGLIFPSAVWLGNSSFAFANTLLSLRPPLLYDVGETGQNRAGQIAIALNAPVRIFPGS